MQEFEQFTNSKLPDGLGARVDKMIEQIGVEIGGATLPSRVSINEIREVLKATHNDAMIDSKGDAKGEKKGDVDLERIGRVLGRLDTDRDGLVDVREVMGIVADEVVDGDAEAGNDKVEEKL